MDRNAPRSEIKKHVQAFYDTLPFNHWGSVESAAQAIRINPIQQNYPDLHRLLKHRKTRRIAEFGCGAGWLSCSIAMHYGLSVTAVDFSASALERANALAAESSVQDLVTFEHRDLFDDHTHEPADLVISLGVLHHTGDVRRAFRHVQDAARADGYLYVGLYHEPGRRVFLDMFAKLVESDGEEAAFQKYCELSAARTTDEEHLRSWFRDQVLHPHETQHTLKEVAGWCRDDGLAMQSTSINQFARLRDLEPLFDLEASYADRSHHANVVEGRFFPGFFTILAQRS